MDHIQNQAVVEELFRFTAFRGHKRHSTVAKMSEVMTNNITTSSEEYSLGISKVINEFYCHR